MRSGRKQVWPGFPRGPSHPPALPRPLPRLPVVCPRRTWRPAAVASLSLAATPPTRVGHTDINKVTLPSHVPTVFLPPPGGRGLRGGGAPRVPGAGPLTAPASPPEDANRRGIPALPRPPTAWPAAAQSPGRWAPAAPDTGSLARSLTTVTGDTMAAAAAAAADTPLRAAAARTRPRPGEQAKT